MAVSIQRTAQTQFTKMCSDFHSSSEEEAMGLLFAEVLSLPSQALLIRFIHKYYTESLRVCRLGQTMDKISLRKLTDINVVCQTIAILVIAFQKENFLQQYSQP